MSESTVKAQQCLRAFVDGNYDESLSLIDQVEEPHKLKDEKHGATLLHWAATRGWLNIVQQLLEKYEFHPTCKTNNGFLPLHSACQNGHLDVVQYLITECKCDPMCKSNNGFLPLHSACQNEHLDILQYLITKCKCDPMSKKDGGNTPLHIACLTGHLNAVRYLITKCKCDPMCKNDNGSLPLHSACKNGHLNVVQYLITKCKCDPMCETNDGDTPLHTACLTGHLNVVQYLITECKCNPMCKRNDGATPLHLATYNRHLNVVQYLNHHFYPTKYLHAKTFLSVDSYVNVVLLGNPAAGKSTLAQVIIQTSSGRHLLGRFRYVGSVELHTAGIVPTRIEHQQLGNIILHDLAGQSEYYSSHIAVLENLLQDYPAVFINCVNLCEEEFLTSLHKWITVIENTSPSMSSPCHVVTVASHVDMITQNEFSFIIKNMLHTLSTRLDSSNVINAGLVGLDCRKLGGGDLSPFMITLSKCCQTIRSARNIITSLYCPILYTFLENERTNVHRVDQLCYRIVARETPDNYYLPETQEDVLETLSSLHSTGLITFLKNNHTPGNSWVIFDKRVLLAKVNGVLFAPETFKQYHDISSNTGIITQSGLTQIFPDLDSEMLVHFLCYMKLSMEITSDMLIHSNLQRKHAEYSSVEEKLLFVPALVRNVQRPHEISGTIQFGWCLQCSNPHHFFFPRFLHLLILHLAYQYALPKTANNPHNRRCTIWTNGILWSDDDGVKTLVEIVDNSRYVLLLMSCEQEFGHNMIKLRHKVIKDILSHQKDKCPRLELQEFIIDPSQLDYPIDKPSTLTLYDIEHIASCVVRYKSFVVPYNINERRHSIKISDLLPYDVISIFAGRDPQELSAGLVSGIRSLTKSSDNHTDSSPCAVDTSSQLVEETTVSDISSQASTIEKDQLIKTPVESTTLSRNTSHTKLDSKSSSPYDVLKRHTSELLGVISGPDKLANDLSSVDLISDHVKDDVLTTLGISRYQKCSILLNEIQKSLNVFNERERLISFCDVLKQQNEWTLSRISDDMMRQLGTNDIS